MGGFVFTAIFCATWIPIGVAALPNPKILAQILALRLQAREESFFEDGNSLLRIGFKIFARVPVKPAFSMSLPTPDQRQIEPAIEIAKVNPACAPWVTPEASAPLFPVRKAHKQEIAKIPVKI
jgi:hypothetical protein